MDVPISPALVKRRKAKQRWLGGGAIAILALVLAGLARLQPAAPRVDKASIWTDTVKRGEMLRQVRGNGTLVPEEIRWIATVSSGRIERILVLPGAAVKADSVLLELSNPELEQQVFEAQSQVKAAKAEMANLRVQLESQKLTQQSAVATAKANYLQAKADHDANEELGKSGLVASLTVAQSKTRADQLAELLDIEKERLKISDKAEQAQLASQEERIAQLTGLADLKRRQLEGLAVRAGMEGVLQRLGEAATLQVGQQLFAGALVARVASQTRLKASIRIPETQARDIQLDQHADIDTSNGIILGHVTRIDPAVENGAVLVDVALDGPLPKGARPDLSVDGVVRLERLLDVLYVGRPVQGQPDSQAGLFKVVDGGKDAIRVRVKLGRGSVSTIEVVNGLEAGDRVILSDMSQWDDHDRVRIR